MNNFILGFFYPFRSIKLFFKYPKLIVYSIVPVIINLIIYGTIFFYTYKWITGKFEDSIDNNLYNGILLEIIRAFLRVFSFFIVLIVCYFLFVILGGIVSAPFNEKISRYVEKKVFGINNIPDSKLFAEALRSIREEIKKIFLYICLFIPLIIIELIPMIGSTISIVLGMLVSVFFNALSFLDYPLDRHKLSFRHKIRIINSKSSLSYGFGATAFLLTFLPFINAIMKPILIAAGTMMIHEKDYVKVYSDRV